MKTWNVRGVVLGAAGVVACAGMAFGQVTLVPVFVQDGVVPGIGAGYAGTPAGMPRIGVNGTVMAPGSLAGPSVDDVRSVLMSGNGSSLRVVAADGMVVPGAPAGFMVGIQGTSSSVDSAGRASVLVTLTDPDTFDITSAYWLGTRGGIAATAGVPVRMYGNGDVAPAGITGAVISSASSFPSLSSSSKYAGYVVLSGTGITGVNNRAILTGVAGQAAVVAARQGMAAPGVPANEPGGPGFVYITDQNGLNINAAGQVLFRAQLVNSSGSSLPFNSTAVYRYEPGTGVLTLVAREGNASGVGSLVYGTQVPNTTIGMNSSGAVAFQTQQGAGTGSYVVWAGQPGALAVAARSNVQAPTLPAGVFFAATNGFSNAFDGVRIADTGAVVFTSVLTGTGVTGTNNKAVFAGVPSNIRSIARLGDQAVGGPSGAVWTSITGVAISASGRVMFSAMDSQSGGVPGVWAQDFQGVLKKVARVGDVVTVGGVGRTLSYVYGPLTGTGSDGLPSSMSAGGTMVLQVGFADQTVGVVQGRLGPRSDYNGVDGLSVQDIFDFLNAWFAGDLAADFNGVNGLEVQDIFDFLNAWFAGV